MDMSEDIMARLLIVFSVRGFSSSKIFNAAFAPFRCMYSRRSACASWSTASSFGNSCAEGAAAGIASRRGV
jgi:hypothetical protein